MNFKYIATTVLLAAAFATPAQAAIVTTTSIGTIYDSNDTLGLFGVAGASLNGLGYQMTLSLDTDDTQTQIVDSSFFSQTYTYGNAPITYSITVNNRTVAGTTLYSNWGQQYLSTGRTDNNPYNANDQIYGYGEGSLTDNSGWFRGYHYMYSNTNAFDGITRDLLSSMSHDFQDGDSGHANFYLGNNFGQYTYFGAKPDTIVLNGAADVPEPATLGLFGLGLAGLAAGRRKRVRQ